MSEIDRVMLAMSGGVDSSAAARILLDRGFEVLGVTFDMLGDNAVIIEAKNVAEALGIQHIGICLEKEFRETVIENFANTYICGGTPNPCIVCNEFIKFKYLLSVADRYNCKYIATGHYARVLKDKETNRYCITKAASSEKDQSYVLYRLGQEVLSRLIFPLGEFEKSEVREIARKSSLEVADKGDSQDICFVPDGDYAEFLKSKCNVKCQSGNFVNREGTVLGHHKGIIHYTVGQRKGLGLALPCPMYVTEKNVESNTVVLGLSEDLFKDSIKVTHLKWMKYPYIDKEITVSVKIRYSQREVMARVIPNLDGGCQLVFAEPQRAPAKGQSAVFYIGDTVVGGGIIE